MTTALLYPGAKGPTVALLQQQLVEHGLLPPEADGEARSSTYGPVTAAAIQTFQAKRGLVIDAIVGNKTWSALQQADPPDAPDMPAPDYAQMPAIMASALQIAHTDWKRGVCETPLGSNRGADVDRYLIGHHADGRNMLCARRYAFKSTCPSCQGKPGPQPGCKGSSWCARFALWCVEGASALLGVVSPTAGAGDLASALKWMDWAHARGKLTDEPRTGRIALIIVRTSPGVPGHGHVMLVSTVDGNKISTREGNSADRVSARWRDIKSISAFVDLGG